MAESIGHGTIFNMIAGSTSTPVNGVLSVDFGSNKVDTLDTTNMGTTGTSRTFMGGLENQGDVTLKLNYKPGDASQQALYALKDGQSHNFSVVYPAAVTTETFTALITSISKAAPDDKLMTQQVKFQITGAHTFI